MVDIYAYRASNRFLAGIIFNTERLESKFTINIKDERYLHRYLCTYNHFIRTYIPKWSILRNTARNTLH